MAVLLHQNQVVLVVYMTIERCYIFIIMKCWFAIVLDVYMRDSIILGTSDDIFLDI